MEQEKWEEEEKEEEATKVETVAPAFYAIPDEDVAPTIEPEPKAEVAEQPDSSRSESVAVTSSGIDKGLDLDNLKTVAEDIAKDLKPLADAASDIAKEIVPIAKEFLSFVRFGAANVLTNSLPEDERQDLLKRMGVPALTVSGDEGAVSEAAAAEMVEKKVKEVRASIQEEIAVARAKEAQKNEDKWEKEKEEIMSEMEQAANARVENELKIQKMKLEEDTAKALQDKADEMKAERERLEQAIEEERERADAMATDAEEKAEVEALFATKKDEEESRNKELEELLEKRQNQKAALDDIEEGLRESVASEEQQRKLLVEMLDKRQGQQDELDTVEANLRTQVNDIESEKTRYQQLVAELEALKEKEQELQQEIEERSADSHDEASEEETEEEPENPVLGPVIADLGYKRIHFVSSGKLGTIPVWSRNRTYRNNRAKSMANEKIRSMELGFPGVICLLEASNGKLSIVDGQHRVGMMAALKEKMNKKIQKGDDIGNAESVFERVLVEVYPEPETDGDAFAKHIFTEINKAEPVKLIDMPGVASDADRELITEAVETLREQFESMFSSSQRCRVPNVNVDNLRSAIFGANILQRNKLTTSKDLVDWLLEQNAALGQEYEKSDPSKQELVSKKQWSKASENNFYLGLENSWLYN
jgi:myosin heavy subunit